jgi:hypothetical protein
LDYDSSGGVDMEMSFLDHLWAPRVMVSQVKTYEVANDANHQGGLKITRAKKDGYFKLIRFEGVYITFLCPMRFEWYPMDAHDCFLYFGFNKDRSKISLEKLGLQ